MTDHASLTPEDSGLSAEYALGLLEGDARRAFESRLRVDHVLLGEVQDWRERLVALTDGVTARPPIGAKRRLEKRLFGTTRGATRMWQGFGIGGMGLAAALAIALFFQPGPPEPDYFTAQIVAQDDSLNIVALFDGTSLRLSRTKGAAFEGRALELWVIAGDSAPISLGVLSEQTKSVQPVPEDLRPLMDAATLAISDEPPGGSPTGQPTGAVLAIGQVTSL